MAGLIIPLRVYILLKYHFVSDTFPYVPEGEMSGDSIVTTIVTYILYSYFYRIPCRLFRIALDLRERGVLFQRVAPKKRRTTEQPDDTITRLIGHQASHRFSSGATVDGVCHVSRIHAQVAHEAATAVSRRPPVAVATLIARGITIVVARQRRR